MYAFQLLAAFLLMGCESERPAAGMTPAHQPQQQAQAAARGRGPLCLELEPPRGPVMLGEPVTLIASVVNCSSQVQQARDVLDPDFGFLQVWLQPPAQPELLHKSGTYRNVRGKPVRSLAPGERFSAFVPVYFGIDGWTIRKPGTYRARVAYDDGESGKLESKPVEFTVAPPASAADRQAADLMMSPEVGRFLATGRDDGGKGSDRLAAIEQQFGQSRYAPYARLMQAVTSSRGGFDPNTKTFRKGACDAATGPLARTIPQIADPLLATNGTTALVNCLRESGNAEAANQAASGLLRAHPGVKDVPEVVRLRGSSRKE